MTTLASGSLELPGAELGPENPLPVFRAPRADRKVDCDESVPEEDRRHLGWATAFRVLPYRMQDSYTRELSPRHLPSLTLENECLRAVFLPGLGGKLYSLVHLASGRELLDRNPVLKFANVALRNAWTSGGVEWNLAQMGHHYLTCGPVFAAPLKGPGGETALRLYEFERCKRLFWQVDFHLPPGSRFLFACVRVCNPNPFEVPMYWWTNIAVPEKEECRTLMPARRALIHGTGGGLGLAQMPRHAEVDLSRATSSPRAVEAFYRLEGGEFPWIAVLDGKGEGFAETSTPELRGRKMFAWGMGASGRRWQGQLSSPGRAYIEIQAGLCRTQLESVPMPAGACWSWTEAFGMLRADPARVQGEDWENAWRDAGAKLKALMPDRELAARHAVFAKLHSREPGKALASGSGWGALERRRMKALGNDIPPGLAFPDETLGPEQEPWLGLLDRGILPQSAPDAGAGAWMIQPEWESALAASLDRPDGRHWLSWLHLGVMRMERLDSQGAAAAWRESLKCAPSALALRNLAQTEIRAERHAAAAGFLREAWSVAPENSRAALAREYLELLCRIDRHAEAVEFVLKLPPEIAARDRIQILFARASLNTGDFQRVEGILNQERLDIREGERELASIWYELQEMRLAAAEGLPRDEALRERVRRDFPLPAHLTFAD